MRVTESCVVLVHCNRLNWVCGSSGEVADQDRQVFALLGVSKSNDRYYLDSKEGKPIWWAINLSPSHSMPLAEDSVFRLGKAVFRVEQIGGTGPAPPRPAEEGLSEGCRICLGSEACEDSDPLLAPCRCQGTIKHVHLSCLRRWAGEVVTRQAYPRETVVSLNNFRCGLCQALIPGSVSHRGRRLSVVEFAAAPPFIVFERVLTGEFHVLPFQQGGSALLGRSQDADMVIDEVSVSRLHAKVAWREGRFTLEDYGSKFGTLARLPARVEVTRKRQCLEVEGVLLEAQLALCKEEEMDEARQFNLSKEDSIPYLDRLDSEISD